MLPCHQAILSSAVEGPGVTGRGFQDHIRAWGRPNRILSWTRWLLVAALLTGCTTSPTGRQQFMLVSPDAAISMAQAAYMDTLRQFARRGKLMNDPLLAERMGRITGRLVAVAVQEYPHTAGWEWSVALVDDADVINSRSGEEEADRLGMRIATKAGYDPQAVVTLWRKMAQHGGPRPPEFLSTHPDPASRMRALAAMVDDVRHLRPAAPPEPHRVRIYMQQ